MSVLKFKGYVVNDMIYRKNSKFENENGKISLKPKLHEHDKVQDETIFVTLEVTAGSLEDKRMPFEASVSIQGEFEYIPEEDKDDFGITTFIKQNAVAILYPYVRTLMSNLTLASNENPAFLLPTINVSEVLERERQKD
ncbi:protein-export chaperone SecB [Lactiplantibacillus pingfangensis]|uniref:protein-export chaperone SecB n=1 Tax=Lactiplantibacillus pingfangensis TaxID=2559915 RepID=UPI0010F94B29|nr:protein-export chaperone SecB [Lactiplantibacillus pingfangensis]